jgi:hypothetical protein
MPLGARVYKRHHAIIRKLARLAKVSEAEIVRNAIEEYAEKFPAL